MKINYLVIEEYFPELVKYEGYLPALARPLGFPMKEYYHNLEAKGLYDKVREKEYENRGNSFSDDVKELEEFVRKNPQFKDFITYDVTDNMGIDDDSHPWVDEVYANLIGDELAVLDDFVPPMFIPASMLVKRNRWIRSNDKKIILLCNKEYKKELFRLEESNERTIYIMQCMIDFIEDYPQYAGLLLDVDAFKKHLWELKKEVHESDND